MKTDVRENGNLRKEVTNLKTSLKVFREELGKMGAVLVTCNHHRSLNSAKALDYNFLVNRQAEVADLRNQVSNLQSQTRNLEQVNIQRDTSLTHRVADRG